MPLVQESPSLQSRYLSLTKDWQRYGAFLGFLLFASFCIQVRGDETEWREFRGPSGQGLSFRNDLPIFWGGPFRPPTWSVTIPGQGWSSPIVLGDSIWLSSAEFVAIPDRLANEKLEASEYGATDFQTHGSVSLFAIRVNAKQGKVEQVIELGRVEHPKPIHAMNSYASPTPCSDGQRIVFHFGSLGTYCLSTTGEVLWNRTVPLDDITGPATSPILHQDLVFFAFDGTDAQYVSAVELETGKEAWRTERPEIETTRGAERRAFSTPLLIEYRRVHQLLAPAAQWLVSYDPLTGSENWRCRIGSGHAIVPRVVYQEGVAFVCSGYMRPELFAIRVDGQGDVSSSHVLWNWKRQVPEIASPVLIQNSILFVSSLGVVTCLSQRDGTLQWQDRLSGSFSASPTATGDLVYLTNQSGITSVIRSGNKMETIATNELFGETLASFAIYQDGFLIRTHPELHFVRKSELD